MSLEVMPTSAFAFAMAMMNRAILSFDILNFSSATQYKLEVQPGTQWNSAFSKFYLKHIGGSSLKVNKTHFCKIENECNCNDTKLAKIYF
jgi:hypothetical protein